MRAHGKIVVSGILCMLLLMSATSTAKYENLVLREGQSIRDPDHQRLMEELRGVINTANYEQNLEIAALKLRQEYQDAHLRATDARVEVWEGRFWGLLVSVLLCFASSTIGALYARRVHTTLKDTFRLAEPWDGQERRRSGRRHRDQLESD